MGKEADLLEAARAGDVDLIRTYVRKIKSSTGRPKSAQKKKTLFQSQSAHSFKSGIPSHSHRTTGLNCRDWNGETPLHLATLNNHPAAVQYLANNGAQVNMLDNQGCLPLHLAAWTGNADICRILVEPLTANDVNTQNKSGDTSLHIASQYGHTAVVRLLLKNEANPMIRNMRGESSLDLASFYGRLETVSLLINEQPALLQQIQHSHSPLHLASRNGQKDVVRKLIQAGYNINARTMNGSALHEAVMYGKVEVIKLLTQSGIDKTIKDKNNLTVEEFLQSQNSAVADSLLLVVRGQENLYHCLGEESVVSTERKTSKTSTSSRDAPREKRSTPRIKLCKHGKPCSKPCSKDGTTSSHHRRVRERSSSGQTSGSSSPPPQDFVRSTAARNSNGSSRGDLRRSDRSHVCSRHQHHASGMSTSQTSHHHQHNHSKISHNHTAGHSHNSVTHGHNPHSQYIHNKISDPGHHQYTHQHSQHSQQHGHRGDVTDISARTRKCHSCQHASQHKQLSTRTDNHRSEHSHSQTNNMSPSNRRSSEQHQHHHRSSTSSHGMVSPPYQSTRSRSGSAQTPNIHLYMSLTESPANHHDYMVQLPVSDRDEDEDSGQSNNDNYMKLSDTTSPEILKNNGDDDTLKNESYVSGGRMTSYRDEDNHEYQLTTPSPDPDKEHFYVPVPKSLNSSGNSNYTDTEPVYDRLPARHQSGDSGRHRIQSSESEEMDSLYDKVPVPCPVLGVDSDHWMYGSPPMLSPESVFNNSSMNGSYQSQDSVYNSPESLSPELGGKRRHLGHIYVNLTNFRSTPDLNSITTQGPKKPPRTPTAPSLNEQLGGVDSQLLRKSSDYVAVSFESGFNSRSTEILNSRGYNPSLSQTFQDRLILSVPPQSEKRFIFPSELSASSSGLDIDDDDPYENMAAIIHQQKSTQPPKVLPRRSKSLSNEVDDQSDDTSTLEAGEKLPNNNNSIDSQDTVEEAKDQLPVLRNTGAANRRSVLRGGRQSARQSVRVLDGLIFDTQQPITGKLLLEQRLPTFDTSPDDSMTALPEDDYEDWKQIDGIFASMGVDGELSEESFLNFLKKDKAEHGTIGSWLTSIGLGQYENVLIINGFDNIKMLNGVLAESDLSAMGFIYEPHINTILSEIKSLPQITPINNSYPPDSVRTWLSSLDLDTQYLDKFHNMDFSTMARVQQIWEVELASVLGVVLLGHQKRILVSLGNDRPGFDGMWRKAGNKVTDISRIVQVGDVRIDGEEDIYFKHDFSGLQSKYQMKLSGRDSPAKDSLERSDSGCSISSGGGGGNSKPDVPDRNYRNPGGIYQNDSNTYDIPPVLPTKKRGGSLKSSSLRSSPQPSPRHGTAGSDRTYMNAAGYNTMASVGRSKSAKQITQTAGASGMGVSNGGYLTMDHRHSNRSSSGSVSTPLQQVSESYGTADYANLTEQGVPLVGNVEGLKLSKAQSRSKRVLNRAKRPLPDLPPGQELTFTVADLPADFKGRHKPEILINGCVNYSSCYLGTCMVRDITGPESTRGAIAKMKTATENMTKLPVVTLAISFKGVDFIDSASKRPICEHEITNIYCAAQDSLMMNYFAYITKDVLTKGLYCHVFCVKSEEMAREIILTLGEAFDIAFYAVKKHPCLLNPDF